MDQEKNKSYLNYLLWAIVVLALAFVGMVIFLYWYSLGGISSEASDWGSFGSLLSGLFTLLAVIAAGAAFIVSKQQLGLTRIQLDKLIKFQEKQEAALEFERYLKHRELFFQLCLDIERQTEGRLIFKRVEDLYLSLFPNNTPSKCQIALDSEQEKEIDAWVSSWQKSHSLLVNPQEAGRASTIVSNILMLAQSIKVLPSYPCRLNEFYFSDGQHYLGLGLYDLLLFHSDMARVIRSLGRFCNYNIKGLGGITLNVAELVQLLYSDFKALQTKGGLVLEERFKVLALLHQLYAECVNQKVYSRGFDERQLFERLRASFESSEKMERYLDSIDVRSDRKIYAEIGIDEELLDQYSEEMAVYRNRRGGSEA